jgi:hypothetical protein
LNGLFTLSSGTFADTRHTAYLPHDHEDEGKVGKYEAEREQKYEGHGERHH